MMMGWKAGVMALGFAGLTVVMPGPANAASKVTNQQSDRFEYLVGSCQGSSGAALYGCIGGALDQLNSGLSYSDIQTVAPGALPALVRASQEIKVAKTKAQAATALNRVQSAVRSLAAKAAGEATQVYGRLGAAMARAQAVIAAGG